MEIILFTVVAAGLYLFSDALLKMIEARRGEPLPNRSLIFFGIIMTLSIITFELLQNFLNKAA